MRVVPWRATLLINMCFYALGGNLDVGNRCLLMWCLRLQDVVFCLCIVLAAGKTMSMRMICVYEKVCEHQRDEGGRCQVHRVCTQKTCRVAFCMICVT